MSIGNLKDQGNKGNNYPWQKAVLDLLNTGNNTGATEATLLAVLNQLQQNLDFEVLLVMDKGNGDIIVRQVTQYDTGVTTYYLPDGTPYVPIGPLVYLDASATLALILAELVTLNAGGQLLTQAGYLGAGWATEATLALLNGKDFATETTLDAFYTLYGNTVTDDNGVIGNLATNRVGGKAVTTASYTPAYAANDAAMLAVDKDNGRLLVLDDALTEATDTTGAILKTSATATGVADSYRLLGMINTANAVKAAPGNLYGWNIINNTAAPVYVKFCDLAAGSTTVGVSAVALTLYVPANGSVFQEPTVAQRAFATAITAYCVTGFLDSDATSPGANNVIVQLTYK